MIDWAQALKAEADTTGNINGKPVCSDYRSGAGHRSLPASSLTRRTEKNVLSDRWIVGPRLLVYRDR